jgi:hypothetical protein
MQVTPFSEAAVSELQSAQQVEGVAKNDCVFDMFWGFWQGAPSRRLFPRGGACSPSERTCSRLCLKRYCASRLGPFQLSWCGELAA